jgi:hypothetical protein
MRLHSLMYFAFFLSALSKQSAALRPRQVGDVFLAELKVGAISVDFCPPAPFVDSFPFAVGAAQ